jgi:RNA recognition motif-containing protein
MQPPCAGQVDDLTNTTLFIGALSSTVTEEDLKNFFEKFGSVVYCKIPTGGGAPKGCAFVQFVNRSAAEHAMHEMHGKVCSSPPPGILNEGQSRSTNHSQDGRYLYWMKI